MWKELQKDNEIALFLKNRDRLYLITLKMKFLALLPDTKIPKNIL